MATTTSHEINVRRRSLLPDHWKRQEQRFRIAKIEYFDNNRWIDSAILYSNKSRTKVIIEVDLSGVQHSKRLNTLNVATSRLKRTQSFSSPDFWKFVFNLNANLIIQHQLNLATNFQIALHSASDTRLDIIRHKIAFFSEEDAESFVRLALEKGALEVTCEDFTQSSIARRRNNNNLIISKRSHLRPISENFPDSSHYINKKDQLLRMPTQISNSTKILRRKSTGSSDVAYGSSRIVERKISPISSAGSVSSEEHIFKRRNSMTTRSRRATGRTSLFYDKVNDRTTEKTPSDDYYTKTKKKSQNSLGSDEMLSSSDEDNLYDNRNDSESDGASPASFEDMIDGFSHLFVDNISRRPFFGSAPTLTLQRKQRKQRKQRNPEITRRSGTTTPPVVRRVNRANTNEKIKKYKFLLVNVENDPTTMDPCTLGLDEENTFIRLEFDDYPTEVFAPNVNNGNFWVENSATQQSSLELPKCTPRRVDRQSRSRSFDSVMSFDRSQTYESNGNEPCDYEVFPTSCCCLCCYQDHSLNSSSEVEVQVDMHVARSGPCIDLIKSPESDLMLDIQSSTFEDVFYRGHNLKRTNIESLI